MSFKLKMAKPACFRKMWLAHPLEQSPRDPFLCQKQAYFSKQSLQSRHN